MASSFLGATLALLLATAAADEALSLLQTRAELRELSSPARQKVNEKSANTGIFSDALAVAKEHIAPLENNVEKSIVDALAEVKAAMSAQPSEMHREPLIKASKSAVANKEEKVMAVNIWGVGGVSVQAGESGESHKAAHKEAAAKANKSGNTDKAKASKSKGKANISEKAANGCFDLHMEYSPRNMDGQKRSTEATVEACQQRCARVQGCAHFSWWANGGCHVSDDAAKKFSSRHVIVGPASCAPAVVSEAKDEKSSTVAATTEGVEAEREEKDEAAAVKNGEQNDPKSPVIVGAVGLAAKRAPAAPSAEKKVDHLFQEVSSEFDVLRDRLAASKSDGVEAYNGKKTDYVSQLVAQKRNNAAATAVNERLSTEIDTLLRANGILRNRAQVLQHNKSLLQGALRELGANVSLARELVLDSLEGNMAEEHELGVLVELEAADLEREKVADHDRRFAEIADAGKNVLALRLAHGRHASDTDGTDSAADAADLQGLLAGLDQSLQGAEQLRRDTEMALETRFHEKLAELTKRYNQLVADSKPLESRLESLTELRRKLRAAVASLEDTNGRLEAARSGLLKFIGDLGDV